MGNVILSNSGYLGGCPCKKAWKRMFVPRKEVPSP
jgi:hypothetical protein